MGYFRENIGNMAGYVPGFQPKSADVVKLNTNENPYPPSSKVMEAIGNLSADKLRRYPEPLADSFRQAAAQVLGIRQENIICTNGGDDLLTICTRAFCEPGRPMAFAQPTYSLYPVLAEIQDCETIEIGRTNQWLADLAKVNASLTIVCNPNAPTTDFVPVDQLAELAGKLDGVLLIDEAYVDFAEDDAVRLIGEYDNVILLRSLSKGYSLAGLRFGFGISDAGLINGLMNVKDSYNVDAVAIAAAAAAIADQKYFRENVRKIKLERQLLTTKLRELGFEVPDSSTNFVLAQCKDQSAEGIFNRLTERNIFVRYFSLPGLEDKLRITVGTPDQTDMLIDALREIGTT